MSAVRVFFARVLDTLRGRRRADRLTEEITEHLAALTEQHQAGGMSPEDARLAALRAFGGVDRVRALHREQQRLPVLESLAFDVRAGVRLLARDRLFTIGLTLVLALGLAVNTTIFTIVNGMTWRSLPVPRGDRVVQITSQRTDGRREGTYTSYADFLDWAAASRTLSDMAAYATATMNVGDDTLPADRLAGVFVSSNTFRLLRMQPMLGRDFAPENDTPGTSPVLLLGHHIWASRYGADPGMVGREIRVNGNAVTVIGVMPPGFRFPVRADLWQPIGQLPQLDSANRDQRRFDIVGRLGDGATVEEAQAEMNSIAAALSAQYAATNTNVGARTRLFTHAFVAPPPEAQEPLVMMIAAAVVLLIACANGANLLLARAADRTREMAMRATLGASRHRIVRQLLIEALLLSAAAAAVGLVFSVFAVRVFSREAIDLNLPYWIRFEFDARVFAYVAIACLGTAVAFGLVPALHLSKTDMQEVLKESGRGTIGGRRMRRWTGALLISELALTVTLLAAAGILVRSSAALGREDALLDLDDLLTASIGLPTVRYDTPEKRRLLHARIREQLNARSTPVTVADPAGRTAAMLRATLSSARPFVDSDSRAVLLDDETPSPDEQRTVQTVGVDGTYFATLALPLLRGRALTDGDGEPGRESIVINDRFAELYFPNTDPLGRRIRLAETRGTENAAAQWFTVVGVSQSVRQRPMSRVAPLVYMPLDAHLGSTLAITARGAVERERTTAALRDTLRVVDRDLAAFNIMPLRRLSELSRWTARLVSLVLAVFAVIASALSAAGLYGMTAYGLAQRTSEIGLRMALGARRSQIGWLLVRSTMTHALFGFALGLAGAYGIGRVLSVLLVGTGASNLWDLAALIAALATITTVACYIPARRAVRLDPVSALREL